MRNQAKVLASTVYFFAFASLSMILCNYMTECFLCAGATVDGAVIMVRSCFRCLSSFADYGCDFYSMMIGGSLVSSLLRCCQDLIKLMMMFVTFEY